MKSIISKLISRSAFAPSRGYATRLLMRSPQNQLFISSRYFTTNTKKSNPDAEQEYLLDPYEQILKQSAMDKSALNERIRLYFKKGQRDLDEFDSILLQLTMHVMQSGDELCLDGLDYLEEIREHF